MRLWGIVPPTAARVSAAMPKRKQCSNTSKTSGGRHAPGSRTRAMGYEGKSGWETYKQDDAVVRERLDCKLQEEALRQQPEQVEAR
jgi:hypothetical protein